MSYVEAHAARRAALDAVEDQDVDFASLETRDREIERARSEASTRRGRPVSDAVRLASLHEGAHTVLAFASGLDVVGALVLDDGSGATWITRARGADSVLLGGAVAERFVGRAQAQPSRADLALMIGSDRTLALSGFEAEEVLGDHWDKVEAVASRLVECGFVSGELAQAIVGPVGAA